MSDRSNDPRRNPREQQGQDSCMAAALPVVVGIGLLMVAARDMFGDKGKKPDKTPDKRQQNANTAELARRLREQNKDRRR